MSEDGTNVGFVDYLQIVAEKAKGFVYEIARDGNNPIVGAVWQTTTIRDSFVHQSRYDEKRDPYFIMALYSSFHEK